jgi:26S proteasome regulatory subunit T1
MARSKKACIVFFDEVDAIGGARFDDGKIICIFIIN